MRWLNCRKLFIFSALVIGLLFGFLYQNSSFFARKFTVVEVIDGDTIKLSDGRSVRYIGIDAPEKDSCFSQEASKLNSDLVLGKPVRLEKDLNEMDQFGRILAYVYVKNKNREIFVNQYLLEKGAAEFFLDTVNLRYQATFIEAAEKSHQEKQGLCGD